VKIKPKCKRLLGYRTKADRLLGHGLLLAWLRTTPHSLTWRLWCQGVSLLAFNFSPEGTFEQMSKHAPFCSKGAATLTSIHQIEPNLASYCCWYPKLPEHVLRFSYIALRKEWQDYMHTSCTCTLNSCSPWGMVHIIAFLANHLLLFAPLFLQWSLFTSRISKHQTSLSLVRWLVRYSIWLLKK